MMNFQQSDALGGFFEGNRARQQYETARLQQQQTLEQIASAQQNREFQAADQPGKRAAEGRLQDLHPGAMTIQENTIDEAKSKKALAALDAILQTPEGPGTEQYLMDRFQIPPNNPFIHAVREAKKQGPEAVEALKQSLAVGGLKARQDAATEGYRADREDARWKAAAERTDATNTSRERTAIGVANINAHARIQSSIDRIRAAAGKDVSLEKQLTRYLQEADAVRGKADLSPEEKAAELAAIQTKLEIAYDLWQKSPAGRRASAEVDVAAATGGKVTTVPTPTAPRVTGAGAQAAPAATAPRAAPAVGEVRNGYKFKGGNPAKQESWEKQ